MKPPSRSWTSLGLLMALFVAFSLALVLGGKAYYREERKAIQTQHHRELQTINTLKIKQLTAWREERLGDARLAASRIASTPEKMKWISHPSDQTQGKTLRRELIQVWNTYGYQNALLVSRDGRLLLAATSGAPPFGSESRVLAQLVLETGNAQMGDFFRTPGTGQVFLEFAAPIKGPGQPGQGVILLRVDPETMLHPILQTWPGPSASAEILLLRREGESVLYLNRFRHISDPALTYSTPVSQTESLASLAVMGKSGPYWGPDYRGIEILADIQPCQMNDWIIVSKIDGHEVLTEARFRERAIQLFVGGSILLAAALLGFLFYLGQAGIYRNLFQATQFLPPLAPDVPIERVHRAQVLARAAGLAVMVLGTLALLGWVLGIPALKSILPGYVAMKANTAIGFLLAGGALSLMASPQRSHLLPQVLAGLLTLLGLATFIQYIFGLDFRIDQLLFQEPPGAFGTLAPGRMAPTTALGFTLHGLALLLASQRRSAAWSQWLALPAGLFALLTLLGYLYGPIGMVGAGHYTIQAIHTTLAFLLLTLGILLLNPTSGFMERFSAESLGGWLLRKIAPAVLLLSALLGWVKVQIEGMGWIDHSLSVAFIISAFVAVLLAFAWWVARALDDMDAIRGQAEGRARESAAEIHATLYGIGDGVIATDTQGMVLHMNPEAERLTGWLEEEAIGRPLEEVFQVVEEDTLQPVEPPVTAVQQEGRVVCLTHHTLLIARDGTRRAIGDSAAPVFDQAGTIARIVLVFRDQTEERRLEHLFQLRLALNEYADGHALEELLTRTLDLAGLQLASPIGFYNLCDEEKGTLTLQQWSTRTRQEFCTAKGQGEHYALAQAGIWADSVRLRQPVIHNDYASVPHRKGLPPGHAEVRREMVVPVIREGRVVAILGVGNKATDYTEKDTESLSFIADVTWTIIQRKLAETALLESERRFRNLHGSMRDAYAQVDLQGHIVEHNTTFQEMLGYTEAEIRNLTYQDLTPQEWHAMEARIVAEEVIPLGYSRIYEKGYFRKDGSVFPVELRTNLLRGEQGQPTGMWALIRDITERKAAEASLLEAERMVRGTLDALSEHIAILDEQGRILAVNRAWRRFAEENGPTQSPVCEGANYLQVCWSSQGPEAAEALAFAEGIRRVMEGQTVEYTQEYTCDSPTEQRWFLAKVTRFEGNGPLRVVVAHNNITTRKLAEEELKASHAEQKQLLEIGDRSRLALLSLVEDQKTAELEIRRLNADLELRVASRTAELEAANQELEAFAYSVSHDLRAPLRHMEGFLSMLARHLGDDLDLKASHYLEVARGASTRMGQLVEGLLSFSRLGRADMQRQRVDGARVVAAVIEEARTEWGNREIHWELGQLPVLHGDPTLLRLVFQNLIGNALKFSRNRTATWIEIRAIEGLSDEVGISVRDNGVGFDPTYSAKLFGVFQRLHRQDEFEGTGIGLANVHRIVARHGGRVWAEGRPGEGATFFVAFPIKEAQT